MVPFVYVVVLNWNGWRDTIECLESIFRLDYPNFRVVVCDNASSDGSPGQIARWARGEISNSHFDPASPIAMKPGAVGPVSHIQYQDPATALRSAPDQSRLILIETGANLGFAGGNNVGLRYVQSRGDFQYVWLLNNDTVVTPSALSALVARIQQCPTAGICGSTLLYYDRPELVQAFGGSAYNTWLAREGHIGQFASAREIPDASAVEERMKYVVGASMLVSRRFLETVGLMDEGYFLFFEEIDWATRATAKKITLAYSPSSIVYHKEGASVGSSHAAKSQSVLAEFYATRNRVKYTRRHHKYALVTVCLALVASAVQRIFYGRWSSFVALIRGAVAGLLDTDASITPDLPKLQGCV